MPISFPANRVVPIDNIQTDIHGKLIILPESNVLTFEGSHSMEDWLEDFQIKRLPWGAPGMMVHSGFLQAYLSVDADIMAALDAAPVNPLWITGHSLGAALCAICSFSLVNFHASRWLDNIAGVYTFGNPRWTNLAGSLAHDALLGPRTWRVVDKLDPVCMVPWLQGRYVHTKQNAWIDGDGALEIMRPELKKFPHQIKCLWQEWLRGEHEPFPDHAVEQYVGVLETILNTPNP
jgi:hypothetical protein